MKIQNISRRTTQFYQAKQDFLPRMQGYGNFGKFFDSNKHKHIPPLSLSLILTSGLSIAWKAAFVIFAIAYGVGRMSNNEEKDNDLKSQPSILLKKAQKADLLDTEKRLELIKAAERFPITPEQPHETNHLNLLTKLYAALELGMGYNDKKTFLQGRELLRTQIISNPVARQIQLQPFNNPQFWEDLNTVVENTPDLRNDNGDERIAQGKYYWPVTFVTDIQEKLLKQITPYLPTDKTRPKP